jgi:hypothetical protein
MSARSPILRSFAASRVLPPGSRGSPSTRRSAGCARTGPRSNKDVVAHTATTQQGGDFDVMLPANKSGTFVLSKAGTFPYYCRFHPNMKATLVVAP